MRKKPLLALNQLSSYKKRFGNTKSFALGFMPIRGPDGFRKLDYEFAKTIDPQAIITKIINHGFNTFALVVKDTDGATLANTPHSWNPTGRDLVAEFSELCEQHDLFFTISVTNMNDAYRGWQHPETVCKHIKNGKNHKAGDAGIHKEGEMRVDLPEGVSFQEMQKKIPFLTEEMDGKVGAARGARGQGYIPLTAFHCPRSAHIDYMITLVKELTTKYRIDGVFADYIRYSTGYLDFCGCERCRTAFAEQYPKKATKLMRSKEWWDFRLANIVEYGRKFNNAIKEIDENIVTGWFNLPGHKFYSRYLTAQDYTNLSKTMDTVSPMTYPYLAGRRDDGKYLRFLADLAHWYTQRNMRHRFAEYGDVSILATTNTVECNVEEMLKSCQAYDYGWGIGVFKYYGTSEAQFYAAKLLGEVYKAQKVGDPAPSNQVIRDIERQVYEKYAPKYPPKWYRRENKKR